MRPLYLFAFAVACACLFSGCSFVSMKSYGMKVPKNMDEELVLKLADRYEIPPEDCYMLDTTYRVFLKSFDQVQFKQEVKNHYQPLQALYYAATGHLNSFQINCYAGGFPNLDWEKYEIFTTFPPKEQAPVDSLLPLDTLMAYLTPLSTTQQFSATTYDHIVVVFWNRWMGRQSKRLIALVQENLALAGEQKVRILYVNMDNYYMLVGK